MGLIPRLSSGLSSAEVRDNLDVQTTRIGNQPEGVVVANPVVGKRGVESKIIDFNGADTKAQQMSVCVYSFIKPGDNAAAFLGPIVGRIEFGAGGGSFSFEFDIPVFRSIANAERDQRVFVPNGVQIAVPASRVGVYARNDANAGLNVLEAVPGTVIGTLPQGTARVGAFAGYNVKDTKLTRTLVWANVAAPLTPGAGRPLATVPIPACARRVIFPRTPLAQALSVEVTNMTTDHSAYVIAAGSVGAIELNPYDVALIIDNTGAADITDGSCVFELEI